MVGRALVMMVPSRADMRPVIIREAMMAQKRHVRKVGWSWVTTTSLLGVVLERLDVVPWFVVCASAGCSSCVAMLCCLDQVIRQWLEGVEVLSRS
jgi:hypothetical protein